jgi:acyl-CoA hydrolase
MNPRPCAQFDFSKVLRAGDVVTWLQGTGEPAGLTRQLVTQRAELPRVTIFVGISASDTLLPAHADHFDFKALNGAGNNRRLAAAGVLDIVPAHVSKVPGLIRARALKVDVMLVRVRPHPKPGFYSVGVMADFARAMVGAARCVIGELDERMPVTSQDALIPCDAVHHLTTADCDEWLMPDGEPAPIDIQVAQQVASVIPDRATIQIGIGSLPVAVCQALMSHRELGVHSGVICDGIVDLIEKGVITNAHKGLDAGRTVTGGLFGGRRLMDWANGNALLDMRSSDHTHSPLVMAQLNNFYSVNSAIEVDLTGQLNSEIAAGRYLGAIGGQADYVRGAQLSPGGRSIIAMASATPDGKYSRIVASLKGAPVTTARADVDLIVTEYGVADLRGASMRERAKRLTAIAHPDFREPLAAAAQG